MSDQKISTYKKGELYDIPCTDLQSAPDQPRKFFDEETLEDLATSIKEHGLLQPILFRKAEDGKLLIVAGERRFRAAFKAGQTTIRACFVEGNSAEIALVENILREDLTPIELAEALQKVKDDHGYNNDALTRIIGKAKSTVSEILSLNKLPQKIRDECRKNPSISRQVLIDIAKKRTEWSMKSAFEKYKDDEGKKLIPRKRYIQRKTWEDKVDIICNELEILLADVYCDTLNATARNKLASKIKKVADSCIAKLKKTSGESKKSTVTKILERVELNKMKLTTSGKTKSIAIPKTKRIEIDGKKTK